MTTVEKIIRKETNNMFSNAFYKNLTYKIENKSECYENNDVFDIFQNMYLENEKINRKKTSILLGVSRRTIQNWIKKIENS